LQYFGVNLEIKPVNKPNSELARIRRYTTLVNKPTGKEKNVK